MTKAIAPAEMPGLPDGMVAWGRSTRRGPVGMYHAHVLGFTACGGVRLDRFHSSEPRSLGDMQYYGACPRCMAKVPK